MRVVICDDDIHMTEQLSDMLQRYGASTGREMEVRTFSSGELLLRWCSESGQEIHLLLLDVEMQGMSGLEVKERVKDMEQVRRIVILTKHREAMSMAFGLKVVNFLEKPLSYSILEKLMNVISDELEESRLLTYKVGKTPAEISSKDIVYLNALRDYTIISDVYGKKTPYILCNMKEWEKKLKGLPFVRVHKSYIVNLAYVIDFRQDILLYHFREKIPVGRSYRDQARKTYEEYLTKMIRKRLL